MSSSFLVARVGDLKGLEKSEEDENWDWTWEVEGAYLLFEGETSTKSDPADTSFP
jgi:hypothetical protein